MPEGTGSGPDHGTGHDVGRRPLEPLRTDGLATLPTGEPVLPRWFVLAMLVLGVAAIAVTVWGFASIDRESLTAAQRRPAGGAEVTIDRGQATFAETRDVEPGPACTQGIRIVGDDGSRAAARVAAAGVCELIDTGAYPVAREGLAEWIASGGQLRIATFEYSGVESSARVEDGRIVVELNAKFQFADAARASPALLHQLVLIADPGWPGEPVGAGTELTAAAMQAEACERLGLDGEEAPRGCRDADELVDDPDGYRTLLDEGFRDDR